MADNIDVKDGNLASKTMRTREAGGVHTPFHIVEESALPTGAATETSLQTAITALAALLTELQLKADLTENQPVLGRGNATDYSPYYNGPESTAKRELSLDPDGQLNIRGPIHTDENSVRINFANSSPAVSIGSVTINGAIVTGTGFLSLYIDKGEYFKLDADSETALTLIESIDSDTQLTLASTYVGGTSGAASRWVIKTVTGSGATITVASGQCTIAAGTTANAISEVKRLIDFSPVNAVIGVSVSQRIANQEIFIGFRDPSATIKYFQWVRLTGTTNTVVDVQSGYNPTGAPSASETQSVTSITLPNGITTASIIQFRVEASFDRIRFYAKLSTDTNGSTEVLLSEIVRVAPHPNDPLEMVVRVVNGTTPATNTNVVVDFMYAKNFNKLQVEQSGNNEGFLAIAVPGQTYFGTAAANNVDLIVLDCSQIREIMIQASGTFVATAQWQWTNDLVTWTAGVGGNALLNPAPTTGLSAVGIYRVPVAARYFRFRTTAYTSGTLNAYAFAVQQPAAAPIAITAQAIQSGNWTVLPGNTANTTAWLVNDIPNAAQGHSTHHTALNTAASAMGTSVKASAGVIGSIELCNNNATTAFYFKIFNKASAPTLGTDTPVKNIRVGPGQTIVIAPDKSMRFATGIAYAFTSGVALLDTGTIATANDVMVNISYT